MISFSAPTHPYDVEVKAIKPGELRVSWKPPQRPNGNVTHYYVYWKPQKIKSREFDLRDYCVDSEYFENFLKL